VATKYEIDIATKMSGGESAASQLVALSSGLAATGAAATTAASTLSASSAAYKQSEVAAAKAAAAAESMAAKTALAAAALAKAAESGKLGAYDSAAAKLQRVSDEEIKLRGVADAAAAALVAEAAALDGVAAQAAAASAAHEALGAKIKETEAAMKAAADASAIADAEAEADALATSQLLIAEAAYTAAEAERKLADQLAASSSAMAASKSASEGLAAASQKEAAARTQAAAALKANGNAQREMWGHQKAGIKTALSIVAAMAAVAAGALAGVWAIAKWGIGLADAARDAKNGGADILSLATQSKKFGKNLAETFGGLKIDGLLKGLSVMVALFDKNTAAGRFLKFVFESVFQPLIDGVAAAAVPIEAFLLGAAIGALRMYIAFKPAIKAVKELFGAGSVSLADMLSAGEVAGKLLFGAIVAVVAVVGAVVGGLVAMHQAIGAAVGMAVSLGTAIRDGIGGAIDYLSGLSLSEIGSALIDGLVSGITAGAGAVIAAVTGIAGGAISAAKSALGISSPSKVFAGIGGFTAEGFAGGVEDGTADASSAMESMVAPPSAGRLAAIGNASGSTGGATASTGGGISLTGPFNFYGVKDAGDAVGMFEAMLNRTLAGDSLSLGGGEVPA
jgi:hypothetical protein